MMQIPTVDCLLSAFLLLIAGSIQVAPCSAFVSPITPSAVLFGKAEMHARSDRRNEAATCLFPRTAKDDASCQSRHRHSITTGATPTRIRTSLSALRKKQSGMEVGVQTAQLLMDPRRHDRLKQSIQRKFPLVPGGALDVCIDITADAFKAIAPKKMKQALRPGGMDKVRPDIERSIVDAAMKQRVVQDIPLLNDDDKTRLMEAIVDVALDYILEDAQEVLAAPEVRLEALEEEIRDVKSTMGPWRLMLYRIRNDPVPIAAIAALSVGWAYSRREHRAFVALASFFRGVYQWVAPVLAVIGKALLTGAAFVGNKISSIFSVLRGNLIGA